MEYKKIISAFGILNRTFLSYTTKSLLNQELSYSDSIFLVNIGEREGITQEEISRDLAIDKAAIARSVKNMQKKGFVKPVQSKVDRRAKELYLTDSGKDVYQLIRLINIKWVDYVFEDLSKEEIQIFETITDKISKRAKEYNA